jgi:hypothetical protein
MKVIMGLPLALAACCLVYKKLWNVYSDYINPLPSYLLTSAYGNTLTIYLWSGDRLCDLVVRFLGYRSEGPGSIPGTTRIKKVVGLERGPISLMSTTEELLDRKVAAPV